MLSIKKDRLFVIILAIIVANLSYQLIDILIWIFDGKNFTDFFIWALAVADIIGIVGALWLIRSYRRGRRANKDGN